MTAQQFDIVIIGGGLVGCSLALILAQQQWNVAVIEAKPLNTNDQGAADPRSLVLSYSSCLLLKTLGLWEKLASVATTIERINVAALGHFGTTRFVAKEHGIEDFGAVIPADYLTTTIQMLAQQVEKVTWFMPAIVEEINPQSENSTLTVSMGEVKTVLTTRLIVAADGSNSITRKLLKIETSQKNYEQVAIIAQLESSQPHEHTAFEYLTKSGPLAILPREDKRRGLIWSVDSSEAPALLQLDDVEFLAKLQKTVGYRVGQLTAITPRASYPLQLITTKNPLRAGFILLGNAAHTLHPLAGQGFNLALRDVAALAEVLETARERYQHIGDLAVLEKYWQWREEDQNNIINFTDGTVNLFAGKFSPLKYLRSLGLIGLDSLLPVRKHLLKRMLGFTKRVPKLLVGVNLK